MIVNSVTRSAYSNKEATVVSFRVQGHHYDADTVQKKNRQKEHGVDVHTISWFLPVLGLQNRTPFPPWTAWSRSVCTAARFH